jgi:hypothetical protein
MPPTIWRSCGGLTPTRPFRVVDLSAIDEDRRLAAEPLEAPQGHLDVDRVDLHRVAASAGPLRGDERGPEPQKGS